MSTPTTRRSQLGLASVIDGARRLLRQRRAGARRSLFLRALQLPDRARRPRRGRRRQRRADRDGPPPRLQADRRSHRHDVAAGQRRRLRRNRRHRTQRRDRRDGCCRWCLQGQHDRGGTARRREGRRERRQDAPRPGARRTHPRVRSQGHRTRRRAVVGIIHHGRHRTVDVVDRHPHQPSGGHRRRRFRTDFRQRADGGERHRGTDLLDLGNRPPGRAIDRNRRPRGRQCAAHRRHRPLARRRRAEDRRRRDADPEHCRADQPAWR